jgi:hypothetical protein
MININIYLAIILILMVFFCSVIFYLKNQQSHFTPVESGIPAVSKTPEVFYVKPEPNVYQTEDTRMEYPNLPPVNPIARQRIISRDIPAERDLFNNQEYGTTYYMLDTPPASDTNQLISSSGPDEMIKIPLQYNEPYNEQLRSQDILVTPYNKIKYGTC